jgi:photosystem II stability/assembly factor-like uncharacterized protein
MAALLLACSGAAEARWVRVDSRTLSWLYSVYFLDENTGWIAGSRGTLLHSTDAGKTWIQAKKFTEDNIRDVYFSDAKNGWLLCDNTSQKNDGMPASYLLHTADGGSVWDRVAFSDSQDKFVRFVFSRDGYGYAVGEGGGIWQMLDDKKSWKRLALPVRYLILGGWLIDDFNGILVGGGGTILFTNDGGVQWNAASLSEKSNNRFNSVYFTNQKLGWTVGAGGKVYFTSNGGRAWHAQESGIMEDLYDVSFLDMNKGYAVGDRGTIIRTTNGGNAWAPDNSGVEGRLERVVFKGKKGFAVGFGGIILTTDQASNP